MDLGRVLETRHLMRALTFWDFFTSFFSQGGEPLRIERLQPSINTKSDAMSLETMGMVSFQQPPKWLSWRVNLSTQNCLAVFTQKYFLRRLSHKFLYHNCQWYLAYKNVLGLLISTVTYFSMAAAGFSQPIGSEIKFSKG